MFSYATSYQGKPRWRLLDSCSGDTPTPDVAGSTFTVAINRRWKDQLACCVSRRVRATSFDAALCALKPPRPKFRMT
jgi:hypothetical protein